MKKKRTSKLFFGIDYGSKLSGTTAVAYRKKDEIRIEQSARKQDADQFILEIVNRLGATMVFIDAPLSLPGIYTQQPHCDDYFYRHADRQLSAMSPMFIGGLTARAIKLKDQLQAMSVQVVEVYPAYLAKKVLALDKEIYKKDKTAISAVSATISSHLPHQLDVTEMKSWHQVDALLAFYSGHRFVEEECLVFGKLEEGLIYV